MLRWGRVEICWGFWCLLAVALLAGAGSVLPLVGLAALCHELGHLGALQLAGARVERFRLTAFGAEIRADTRYLAYWKEIGCTLAGPAMNLALALVLSRVAGDYLLAGANLLLGVFNLLPIPTLDGGRALQLAVSWAADPMVADRVSARVGLFTAGCLTLASAALAIWGGGGLFPLLAALGALIPQLPLVKRRETG